MPGEGRGGRIPLASVGHVEARELPMSRRIVMATFWAWLLAAGGMSGAHAQQPISAGQPAVTGSGWTFNVAPYLWMPHLDVTNSFNLPPALGGTLSTESSIGFGDVLSHLNFGVMAAADARYDRFSILTDFLYFNLGDTAVRLKSVNFSGLPSIPISTAAQTSAGLNANAKIWTLAGGYTVLQGDWGNFDVIGGFRCLGVPASVNYRLALTITSRAAT